jgi:type VI secretion system protein ImpK
MVFTWVMGNRAGAESGRAKDPRADAIASNENLALLYQGLFTGIVRVQAKRQPLPDANSFRRRTIATLQEIERVGIASGYDGRDIRDTHFAVVAWLDSVVLHSNDPVRAEWEGKTLQEELFGKADAGVVFFEKLEQFRSRRDSEQLADILEVYLLCLLLGFEGRYSGGPSGEVHSIIERVGVRIDDIRGRNRVLSPSSSLPVEAAPVAREKQDFSMKRLRLLALAILCFTVLFFWILKWGVDSSSDQAMANLNGLL